jgi:hypothetical protein
MKLTTAFPKPYCMLSSKKSQKYTALFLQAIAAFEPTYRYYAEVTELIIPTLVQKQGKPMIDMSTVPSKSEIHLSYRNA